jgi:hypothetical protein
MHACEGGFFEALYSPNYATAAVVLCGSGSYLETQGGLLCRLGTRGALRKITPLAAQAR